MASRFWVGGTGAWDAVTTTHWSATSGGAGGASVPGVADDVHLDANSGTGTVTLSAQAEIGSVDFTGYAGTLTGAGFFLGLNLAAGGNVTLPAAMTVGTLAILWHSGVSGTLTTNGKTLSNLQIGGGSAGGVITLGDNLTAAVVTLTSGTLNTNGKTCNWTSFNANNTNTRVLTLGTSAVTLTGISGVIWDCTIGTGMTITANTATVNFTNTGITFRSGGLNWNGLSIIFSGGSGTGATISGGGTFKNVTITGAATKTSTAFFTAGTTTTFTGTLTITGNSAVNRVLVQSGALGATATLNAAVVALTNADFIDVIGAGAAAPFTGTSLGDALGNSGITFTAAVTQTWVGTAGGNWSDVTKWTSRVPLPQDDVLIASAFVATQTITVDMPRLGRSISFVGVSGNPTWAVALATTMYGSLTLAAGMTYLNTTSLTLQARSAQTITMAGRSHAFTLQINGPGATYTMQDDLSGSGSLSINFGTLDANGHNVTLASIAFNAVSNVRQLNMGSGTWTLTGTGTVWNVSTPTGLTINAGTSLIDITDASAVSKTFSGGNFTYATLRYRSAGSGALQIFGNNTFVTLDLEATTARQIQLAAAGSQYVLGTLTLKGAAGQQISLASTTAGNQGVLWALPGSIVTQQFVTVGVDVVYVNGQQIALQNVITDASRIAALSWGTTRQGGSTDGLATPAGIGVWRQGTNLFRRGQCDALNDWNAASGGTTRTLDASVPPPFSTQSIKVTTDGSLANQGLLPATATGQAAPAGTLAAGSIRFKGVAGQSYFSQIRWLNTDATVTDGAQTAFVATGSWQLITPSAIAVAAGKTGDSFVIHARINGTRAESFWLAHAMLESGVPYVRPYIATSGGVTATVGTGRAQIAAGVLLGAAKTWFAVRFRPGWKAADDTSFPGTNTWEVDTSNRVGIIWNGPSQKWAMDRRIAGAPIDAQTAVQTHAAGDTVKLLGYYDGVNVGVSITGGAFTTAADARALMITAPVLDIASVGSSSQINGTILSFAYGVARTPTTADAAAVAALPDSNPDFSTLTLAPAMVWPAVDATYDVPPVATIAPVIS